MGIIPIYATLVGMRLFHPFIPARLIPLVALLVAAVATIMLAGCGSSSPRDTTARPSIVVTTPMLGAVVRKAVGDTADVRVLMLNGSDPHEWRPSAQDVAALENADLIVENGLGLEEGLADALARAREGGTPMFTATDHVAVRTVRAGQGADPSDPDHGQGADPSHPDHGQGADPSHPDHGQGADPSHPDQGPGARDPHIWTDPTKMRDVVLALPAAVKRSTGADISATARTAAQSLAAVDREVSTLMARVPSSARGIVTGHDTLGYFADRYGYRLVGAIIPSLSTQGQISAAHLAALDRAMRAAGVRVVFDDVGTPAQVSQAVANDTGATVVKLNTVAVGADGSYESFIRELGRRVSSALAKANG